MKKLDDINDWLDIKEHQKIGEILMQCGKFELVQLDMALDVQRFDEMQLGEIFLNMNVISKEELQTALDLQNKIDSNIQNEKKGAC